MRRGLLGATVATTVATVLIGCSGGYDGSTSTDWCNVDVRATPCGAGGLTVTCGATGDPGPACYFWFRSATDDVYCCGANAADAGGDGDGAPGDR